MPIRLVIPPQRDGKILSECEKCTKKSRRDSSPSSSLGLFAILPFCSRDIHTLSRKFCGINSWQFMLQIFWQTYPFFLTLHTPIQLACVYPSKHSALRARFCPSRRGPPSTPLAHSRRGPSYSTSHSHPYLDIHITRTWEKYTRDRLRDSLLESRNLASVFSCMSAICPKRRDARRGWR